MSGQSLTWVPQTIKPRAKAISGDEWNKHKEELCNLYREKTVREVQSHMDEAHGFHASRKQYVSRFLKWGMRKYQEPDLARVDKNDLANELFVPRHVCEANEALGMEFSTNAEVTPRKRSLPSSFSSGRIRSNRGPSKPAKEGDMLRLPSLHHEDTDSRVDESLFTTNLDQPSHCGDYCVPPTEDFEEWAKGPGSLTLAEVYRMDDRIDNGSRELSTFSKSNIRNMKCAADLLRSIGQTQKAFRIYTVLLKYLKSSASAPDSMVTWMIIACVTSASTSPQFEISRVLLEKKSDELSDHSSPHENFLFRRLLAMIYGRMGDTGRRRLNKQIAYQFLWKPAVRHKSALLPGDRLLKLYIYFYIEIDGKDDFDNLEIPSDGLNLEYMPPAIPEILVYREHRHMEVQEDAVQSQCLQSCIEWCHDTLPREARYDYTTFPLPTGLIRSPLGLYVSSVLLRLWKVWQREREHSDNLSLWMTHSEKLMGISPCEVLRVTIRMCIDPTLSENPLPDFTPTIASLWALKGAGWLTKKPDKFLFQRFLEVFKADQTDLSRMCVSTKPIKREVSVIEEHQQKAVEKLSQHNPTMELPSLVRSLESSTQYSSFRALATRIREKPRDTDSRPNKPSSVLRGNSVADFTIEGFSSLCESFRSSFSLSSSSKRSLDRKLLQSQV
ncbi:MAG: hypothetical protein M1822_008547 [Bathelium mastoideum]|nr:MAG: hypothetical protein M1822_008547 [Bathelium mastoideum]